jgi:hypothetical protein
MSEWSCPCGAEGSEPTAAARNAARREHRRLCEPEAIDWLRVKFRYPSTWGLTEQQWVDRWNARPELFERLVRAFEVQAEFNPLPRRRVDLDQRAI